MSSSLPPPQALVDEFKTDMIELSKWEDWSNRLISAGSDTKELRKVLYSVLHCCSLVVSQTALKKSFFATSTYRAITEIVESLNDDEVEEWKSRVQNGDWADLIKHPKLQKPAEDLVADGQAQNILYDNKRLGKAYTQHFIGDYATEFIKHLERADVAEGTRQARPLHAKTIFVVQSSGTGKSRMLTEVGKQIFTLPVCLRKATDPGYPPGDKPVVNFFSAKNNDGWSVAAHIAIACFIAAAHQTMLETLQEAYNEKGLNGPRLLEYWHGLIEPTGARDRREAFFTTVVERADSMKLKAETAWKEDSKPIDPDLESFAMSRKIYELHAKEATKKLMDFLSAVLPAKRISVMYFDEAREPDPFWLFLSLVGHQLSSTKMWYTFIGTKSSYCHHFPLPSNLSGVRFKSQVARLLTPYIDLGFDQQAIAKSRAAVSVRMGDMETIEFISQYGRPMWSALLPEETPGEIISWASWKLRNGEDFRATDKDHVFAVLSQRLCLDLVLAAAEAIALADRSVTRRMGLLTGFSADSDRFYTHSPSEPVLVMGSIDILYNTSQSDLLGQALNTLSKDLCAAGLIEKGVLGELGARTLILIARDFAAPPHSRGRNLLKPVPLLHFLDTLFGRDKFNCSDKLKFDTAFGMAHVNFTHWISTQDSVPQRLDEQLLANLWARGAALQCYFSQESIYFLIPLYHGSVHPDSNFDPSRLSAVVVQVKYKAAGDKNAELAIRPINVPHQPLPYLAVFMELGNESYYNDNGEKIKCAAPEPPAGGEFGVLWDAWTAAAEELETYHRKKNAQKDILEDLKKKTKDAQLAVDSCNRYSISARGVSQDVYDVLRKANIAKEFATLLSITMPSPVDEQSTRQLMRPLERLSDDSPHTAWMSEYTVPNKDGGGVETT